MTNYTYLFIFLAFVFALGLSFYQYYLPKKATAPKLNLFLAFCRFSALFGFFLLLINPQITQKTNQNIKTVLPVYIDQSKSIEMLEANDASKNAVQLIANHKDLNEQFDVQFFGFGADIELLNDSLNDFTFSENQSRLDKIAKNNQINYPHLRFPTLIISDGNQTQGLDFPYAFDTFNPVHGLVLGDTTTVSDVRIGQINVNKYAFYKNKFPVEVFVHYTGSDDITADFSIENKGKKIHSQKITFDSQKQAQVIEVLLSAQEIGLQQFTVKATTNFVEKNTDNNIKDFYVDIIDQRTEIAIVSEILHPDLGAIKRAIETNSQRNVTLLNANSPVDWAKFDVLILYQPNSLFKPFFENELLAQKNKLIITGLYTDFEQLGNFQSDFSFKMSNQKENYTPDFPSQFSLFNIDLKGFERVQPLQNKFGTITPKSNVQVLAQAKILNTVLPQPLIGFTDNANQRNAYIFGQDIWKWRSQVYLNQEEFKNFDILIDKTIQFLSVGASKKRLDVSHENIYNSGDDIRILAQFFNKNYEFEPEAQLAIKVVSKNDGTVKNFDFILNQQDFRVNLNGLLSGSYDFVVTENESNISYKSFFEIIAFDVEKQFVSPNFTKLSTLASRTNGSVFLPSELNNWIENLLKNKNYTTIQKQFTKQTPLIEWYILLIIIALFLSLEWFIRKYNGLL
uniref:hypothetical protein n=1 Tax=Flavobacterium sp. TaxID=239 RepID=UPI0040497897